MMKTAAGLGPVLLLALVVPVGIAHGAVRQDSLSLAGVYALVQAHNPTLRAAQALSRATAAREPGAGILPDPMIQLGVMNFSLPDLSTSMPSSMAPSIQAMQMVPFPGKLGLSSRIAGQSTAMAQASADERWWEVRSRAALAFFELYRVDRQLDVMRETLGLLQDFQRVAGAMYAAGTGHQSDVLRANVEVARTDAEIQRMQAMRTAAAARLNAVMDRPADTPVPRPTLPSLPLDLPSAQQLRDRADRSRPLLARSRLGLEQAETRESLAGKQIWPDFTLGVQYGQRNSPTGTQHMASAMVGFSVPVFAGKRQLRARDEAAALEEMATAQLADTRAQIDARLTELVAELERTRTLVRLYRAEVLPQAGANVQSAFSSYRVGAVDFMTLVDAQMTTNRYRQEYYALLADYGRSLADLEMTIGEELPPTGQILAEDR